MDTLHYDWETEWEKNISDTAARSGTDYWNRRAEDYNDYIVNSGFSNGITAREILETENILQPDFHVLDIASGPGAMTIPFAEKTAKVTAVEPTKNMQKYLMQNAEKRNLNNIVIMEELFENLDMETYANQFDLVVISHGLFHFPDIGRQLMRINALSKGYCCIMEGLKENQTSLGMHKQLDIDNTAVDYDSFIALYNILYRRRIFANVKIFDSVMRRSVASAISLWEKFLEKYRPVTQADKVLIREHVAENTVDGMYTSIGKMGMLYWQKIDVA